MTERPIALFLNIPPRGVALCCPLFACFIMQMWNEWEMRAEQEPDSQLPLKIQCYMDEFANLGHIYGFSEHYTTMRAMGVGLLLVLQAHSQLRELYGDNLRDVLLTNVGTHLLLPGGGPNECKYYSDRIGDTTVLTYSQTTTGGDLFGGGQRSTTTSERSRPLFTPGELRTIAQNQMLVMPAQLAPMLVTTIPYTQDREVRDRANLPYAQAQTTLRPEPPDPPTWPSSQPKMPGKWGVTPPTPQLPPGWKSGSNTGRVVGSDDDDDAWPGI